MYLGVLLALCIIVKGVDCSGAGPPGSSPLDLQTHGGAPGTFNIPGAQLIFPPNPDIGRLMKVDDPDEANKKHIFSDPRGPLGIINENGEYVPLGQRSSELRSKNTPQVRQDRGNDGDWQTINAEDTRNNRRNEPQTVVKTRDRASILYNMFNRRYQPSPQVHQPSPVGQQPGPHGPPQVYQPSPVGQQPGPQGPPRIN